MRIRIYNVVWILWILFRVSGSECTASMMRATNQFYNAYTIKLNGCIRDRKDNERGPCTEDLFNSRADFIRIGGSGATCITRVDTNFSDPVNVTVLIIAFGSNSTLSKVGDEENKSFALNKNICDSTFYLRNELPGFRDTGDVEDHMGNLNLVIPLVGLDNNSCESFGKEIMITNQMVSKPINRCPLPYPPINTSACILQFTESMELCLSHKEDPYTVKTILSLNFTLEEGNEVLRFDNYIRTHETKFNVVEEKGIVDMELSKEYWKIIKICTSVDIIDPLGDSKGCEKYFSSETMGVLGEESICEKISGRCLIVKPSNNLQKGVEIALDVPGISGTYKKEYGEANVNVEFPSTPLNGSEDMIIRCEATHYANATAADGRCEWTKDNVDVDNNRDCKLTLPKDTYTVGEYSFSCKMYLEMGGEMGQMEDLNISSNVERANISVTATATQKYNMFTFTFYTEVIGIDTTDTPKGICSQLFTSPDLQLLGPDPHCSVDGKIIKVFGDSHLTLSEGNIFSLGGSNIPLYFGHLTIDNFPNVQISSQFKWGEGLTCTIVVENGGEGTEYNISYLLDNTFYNVIPDNILQPNTEYNISVSLHYGELYKNYIVTSSLEKIQVPKIMASQREQDIYTLRYIFPVDISKYFTSGCQQLFSEGSMELLGSTPTCIRISPKIIEVTLSNSHTLVEGTSLEIAHNDIGGEISIHPEVVLSLIYTSESVTCSHNYEGSAKYTMKYSIIHTYNTTGGGTSGDMKGCLPAPDPPKLEFILDCPYLYLGEYLLKVEMHFPIYEDYTPTTSTTFSITGKVDTLQHIGHTYIFNFDSPFILRNITHGAPPVIREELGCGDLFQYTSTFGGSPRCIWELDYTGGHKYNRISMIAGENSNIANLNNLTSLTLTLPSLDNNNTYYFEGSIPVFTLMEGGNLEAIEYMSNISHTLRVQKDIDNTYNITYTWRVEKASGETVSNIGVYTVRDEELTIKAGFMAPGIYKIYATPIIQGDLYMYPPLTSTIHFKSQFIAISQYLMLYNLSTDSQLPSFSLCSHILHPQLLPLLGNHPICTSPTPKVLQLKVGADATLTEGTLFGFKENILGEFPIEGGPPAIEDIKILGQEEVSEEELEIDQDRQFTVTFSPQYVQTHSPIPQIEYTWVFNNYSNFHPVVTTTPNYTFHPQKDNLVIGAYELNVEMNIKDFDYRTSQTLKFHIVLVRSSLKHNSKNSSILNI